MSCNINHCHTLKCDAWISATDVEWILDNEEDLLPETHFLYEAKPFKIAQEGKFVLKDFMWGGTCSGHFWDNFVKNIAPKIQGHLEVILTWEDGSASGLRIKNGVVTEPKVIQTLAEE